MADPVQQAGGGEEIPAPIDTQSAANATVPAVIPEQKPTPIESPAVEPPAVQDVNKENPIVEAKVDAVSSESDSIAVSPPPVVEKESEPSQATSQDAKGDGAKEIKGEEVAATKVDQIAGTNVEETKNVKEEVATPETKQNEEALQTKENGDKNIVPPGVSNDKEQTSNDMPKESGDWQKRESELLKKIEELEKVKNARSEDGLRLELKVREEEIDLLKARVKNLETELQAALSKPGGKNHEMIENIKQQHEELLSKARGMIFDKTKMVKNQELQIEALTTQVQSLKDINVITKDLLEIRNSEVKAMEERFQAMEARFKAEKERYDLVLKRAQTSTNINDDLRKEYETQLAIFKELREKYEQRVQALVAENNRLKEAAKGPGTSG